MEFLPDSLERHMRGGQPIPYRRAVEIAIQVCRGLAHAYSQGVIHRDIKPGNILLTSDGNAQVTDFGIARAIVSSTRAPQTGAASTYHYMPPSSGPNPRLTAGLISTLSGSRYSRCSRGLCHLMGQVQEKYSSSTVMSQCPPSQGSWPFPGLWGRGSPGHG